MDEDIVFLRRIIEAEQKKNKVLRKKIAVNKQQTEEIRQEAELYQAELQSRHQTELAVCHSEIKEWQTRFEGAEDKADFYEALYNKVITSKSWKITEPLRWIMNSVRSWCGNGEAENDADKSVNIATEEEPHCPAGNRFTEATISCHSTLDTKPSAKRQDDRQCCSEEVTGTRKSHNLGSLTAPTFSLLMPIYGSSVATLEELFVSLRSCAGWEIVAVGRLLPEVAAYLSVCEEYADGRFRFLALPEGNAGQALSMALQEAKGDYAVILPEGAYLLPGALPAFRAATAGGAEVVYADEVIRLADDESEVAVRKPNFSAESLRGSNFLHGVIVVQMNLLREQAVGLSLYGADAGYDLVLRLTERTTKICHLPQVLSCRTKATEAGTEAEMAAINRHLARTGINGEVLRQADYPGAYRIKYEMSGPGRVSIIIPNKNHYDDLRNCVESLVFSTSYADYEIIIVDNGSEDAELAGYYEAITKYDNIRVVYFNEPFNFARINNYAVQYATGDYIVLLNNDTEVLSSDWLQELLMLARRKEVGIVGAKLYLADDRVQHAGMRVAESYGARHMFLFEPRGTAGEQNRLVTVQEMSAVTGACMMLRREVYEAVSGMDEAFAVTYNDVDLCLKVREAGYTVLWTPFAELYHYEGSSRGSDASWEKAVAYEKALTAFREKWQSMLGERDVFYSSDGEYLPRIYVDVTVVDGHDHQTGIQRVVNNIYDGLYRIDRRVTPIRESGSELKEAAAFWKRRFERKVPQAPKYMAAGDKLLLLDSSWQSVELFRNTVQVARQNAAWSYGVIYDLFPIQYPELFDSPAFVASFVRWHDMLLECCDAVICISRTVADAVADYFAKQHFNRSHPLEVYSFHLGADIKGGTAAAREEICDFVSAGQTFLMVGTIEPRKGHTVALDAFDRLFAEGVPVQLLIIGKNGWQNDDFLNKYNVLKKKYNKVLWIEDATDEELRWAYKQATALIAASRDEGFGLPLVEAAYYGLPVICSDIPIFHEVTDDKATFFAVSDSEALAEAVNSWLDLGVKPDSGPIKIYSWDDSAAEIMAILQRKTEPYRILG